MEDGRNETDAEQVDRKFGDLLQELRVMQTGAQLTAGFLLTLPFQDKFSELDRFQEGLYLGWYCSPRSRRPWCSPPSRCTDGSRAST